MCSAVLARQEIGVNPQVSLPSGLSETSSSPPVPMICSVPLPSSTTPAIRNVALPVIPGFAGSVHVISHLPDWSAVRVHLALLFVSAAAVDLPGRIGERVALAVGVDARRNQQLVFPYVQMDVLQRHLGSDSEAPVQPEDRELIAGAAGDTEVHLIMENVNQADVLALSSAF